MTMIVGLSSQQEAPRPLGLVRGISDHARAESERRMVGLKPAPAPRPATTDAERRDAA
jgi:hypothetical protein